VWGITGAAVAWAASVVVRNAMTLVQVYRMNRITPFSRASAVVAAAAVLCFAVPLLVVGAVAELTAVTFLATMVVGAAAYALLLWIERGPLALSAFSALLPARRRGAG
jgi:O-antigen/teichoic acid export membrane protein